MLSKLKILIYDMLQKSEIFAAVILKIIVLILPKTVHTHQQKQH